MFALRRSMGSAIESMWARKHVYNPFEPAIRGKPHEYWCAIIGSDK